MRTHTICPVCGGLGMREVRTLRCALEEPPRDIQQAGTNAVLGYALGVGSVDVATVLCRHCRHVFLNPTFEESELNRLYSVEMERRTKIEYRRSEASSGHTWAEQHGIAPGRQHALLEEATQYRPKRLAELVAVAVGYRGWRPARVCDVGGQGGELTSALSAEKRYLFDRDLSHVHDPGVTPLRSISEYAQHGPYSLLVLSHVLEHITHPTEWVRQLVSVLQGDGLVYVEVPLEYCGIVLRRHAVPLGQHVNYFCLNSLSACLRDAGLAQVRVARREIAPYGECRLPVIKVIAGRSPDTGGSKSQARSWAADLAWDSLLTLHARRGWYRLSRS